MPLIKRKCPDFMQIFQFVVEADDKDSITSLKASSPCQMILIIVVLSHSFLLGEAEGPDGRI